MGVLTNTPAAYYIFLIIQGVIRSISSHFSWMTQAVKWYDRLRNSEIVPTKTEDFLQLSELPEGFWPNISTHSHHVHQKLLYMLSSLDISTHSLHPFCKIYKGCRITPKSTAYTSRPTLLKSGSPKIVKLATRAITLTNWFKCLLSTLNSQTSSWQILSGNFTLESLTQSTALSAWCADDVRHVLINLSRFYSLIHSHSW